MTSRTIIIFASFSQFLDADHKKVFRGNFNLTDSEESGQNILIFDDESQREASVFIFNKIIITCDE